MPAARAVCHGWDEQLLRSAIKRNLYGHVIKDERMAAMAVEAEKDAIHAQGDDHRQEVIGLHQAEVVLVLPCAPFHAGADDAPVRPWIGSDFTGGLLARTNDEARRVAQLIARLPELVEPRAGSE